MLNISNNKLIIMLCFVVIFLSILLLRYAIVLSIKQRDSNEKIIVRDNPYIIEFDREKYRKIIYYNHHPPIF